MQRQRLRLLILVVIFILVIIGRNCVFRSVTTFPGSYFNQGTNAAWLGIEWVNEPHSRDEIVILANDLNRRQIDHIFVFTSYLRSNGKFNSSFAHATEFVQIVKEIQPNLKVLAWIGLPLQQANGPSWGYVDLSNQVTRQEIVTFSTYLIRQMGFDGVHLDPEPIPNGDANTLVLLTEAKQAIGTAATLSIATRRIWPVFPDIPWPFVGQVAWGSNYYREIAERVDQIVIMTYDSGMFTPWLYRQFVRFQVIQVSHAVDGTRVQLLIGIPTSEENTQTHNPTVENITSGLQGVIDGLNDTETRPGNVSGVAIYPYWEMDEPKWKAYESLWLGKE